MAIKLGASPQSPGIYRFSPNPEAIKMRTGVMLTHPGSVLGPESALGLLPSMALSSVQVECKYTGYAPKRSFLFKTDSFTNRYLGLRILGLWNVWN